MITIPVDEKLLKLIVEGSFKLGAKFAMSRQWKGDKSVDREANTLYTTILNNLRKDLSSIKSVELEARWEEIWEGYPPQAVWQEKKPGEKS